MQITPKFFFLKFLKLPIDLWLIIMFAWRVRSLSLCV